MGRPLQMTQVEIALRGEDRITDAPHVAPGKVRRLENVTFRNPGAYLKRHGFDAATMQFYGGASFPFSGARRCLSHRKEILACSDTELAAYDKSLDKWAKRAGWPPRLHLARREISHPTGNSSFLGHNATSAAYANGIICVTYTKTVSGTLNQHYMLIDELTGTIIIDAVISGASTSSGVPRAVGVGTKIAVVYYTGTNIDAQIWDTTTVTATSSTLVAGGPSLFDCATVHGGTDFVLAHHAGGNIKIERFNSSGVSQDSASQAEAGTPTVISVFSKAGEDAYILYTITGKMRGVGWEANDFSVLNFAPKDVSATDQPQAIQITETASSTRIGFGYHYDNSGVSEWRYGSIGDTGAIGLITTPIANMKCAAHGFLHASRGVFPVQYAPVTDTDQQTMLLYQAIGPTGVAIASGSAPTPQLLGTYARGFAAGVFGGHIQKVGTLSKWVMAASLIKARATSEGSDATRVTEYGVDLVTIDGDPTVQTDNRLLAATWGNSLVMAGAQVSRYDGVAILDDGHPTRPDHDTAPTVQSGGTLTASTEYKYVMVWEWVGADGLLARSAPSDSQLQTTGGAGFQTLRLTIPAWVPGNRRDAPNDVACAIYRTDPDNGEPSLYYFLDRVTPSVGAAITYDDDGTPGLTTSIPLYTDSGQLPLSGPPSCTYLVTHRDRLFAFGCEDTDEIEYTGKYRNGFAPEWAVGLRTIRVPGAGGFTCGASLDTVLIAFTASGRIFAIIGDGPDVFGGGQDFAIQEVKTPAGCINPRSVVATFDGVAFQSPKGMLKVDRNLQVTYLHQQIGRAINTDHDTIVGAVHRQNHPEVMFAMSGKPEGGFGRSVLYDYRTDDAAEHLYPNAMLSVAESDGTLFWVDSSGNVHVEDTTAWKDNGTFVAMACEFAMSGQNVAGWMLAYTFNHVARWKSAHGLTYQFKWDTDEDDDITSWDNTITRTEAQVTAAKHPQQIGFPRQDWRNSVIRIADTAPASDDGQGSEWVAFVMDIGIEPGFARLPEAHLA